MNQTTTKHATTCRRKFARLDRDCPRCQELAAGATPRQWRSTERTRADDRRRDELRRHDCRKAGCGPVCTHGDW